MTDKANNSLIDPTAQVIDKNSSTRSIKLIHRALLSHMVLIQKAHSVLGTSNFEGEPFEVEYNSTSQLSEDIGNFLKSRKDA